MLNIKLSEDWETRLEALAKQAGQSKDAFAIKAIEDFIEEVEDATEAGEILARVKDGTEKTFTPEELARELEN